MSISQPSPYGAELINSGFVVGETLEISHEDIEEGDVVINTGAIPIVKKGKTNMLKVSIID